MGIYIVTLLGLALWDSRYMTLPDVITLPLLFVGLGLSWVQERFFSAISAALLVFCALYVGNYLLRLMLKQDAWGGGDMKLLAAMAAWHGLMVVGMTMYVAILLGGLVAALLLLKTRKRGQYMAFGPFLVLGHLLVLIFLSMGYASF